MRCAGGAGEGQGPLLRMVRPCHAVAAVGGWVQGSASAADSAAHGPTLRQAHAGWWQPALRVPPLRRHLRSTANGNLHGGWRMGQRTTLLPYHTHTVPPYQYPVPRIPVRGPAQGGRHRGAGTWGPAEGGWRRVAGKGAATGGAGTGACVVSGRGAIDGAAPSLAPGGLNGPIGQGGHSHGRAGRGGRAGGHSYGA